MESKDQKTKKPTSSFPLSNKSLQDVEIKHLINVIRQRYISPYKIIYMISQEEADLFKARNKTHRCCSSSEITIPKDQMTKTQLFLFQAIQDSLKITNLNKILQQIADKYENILKSGQKQNLKLDDQVQKFIIQKALSEGFNLHLYKLILQKLKEESKNVSRGAILWATPQTWYAKYPNIPLDFLSSKSLTDLTSSQKGFANQLNFLKQQKDNLLRELIILQQDGKFEVQIYNKDQSNIRNDSKHMIYPERYCFDGSEDFYNSGQMTYPFLKKTLLILRSLPFELNQKLNAYCTMSENNEISYFKKKLIYKVNEEKNICSYKSFSVIGKGTVKCKLISKVSQHELADISLQSGGLILIDTNLCLAELEGEGDCFFLFKSRINTLEKKK